MLCKIIFCLLLLFFSSCTFDYGGADSGDADQPDIVMTNVTYVRVRSSDPVARFEAERAERYEERAIMKLQHFTFKQFGSHVEEINTLGRVGGATIEIDSGDISMYDGVSIEVESEDLIIETKQIDWKDGPRLLIGGPDSDVNVFQSNGTSFNGVGFRADARRRTWEFADGVRGTYIYDDKEAENGTETETGGEM